MIDSTALHVRGSDCRKELESMRGFFTIALTLGFGVLIGWSIKSIPSAAAPEAAAAGGRGGGGGLPCATSSGDVNGDGDTGGITDALALLTHNFLGDPPELAPLCASGDPAGLPETGQRECYDLVEGVDVQVPCETANFKGQDAAYSTGCPIDGPDGSGRFADNGDGTVTDNCTGLMWQKDTADVNGNGQSTAQDDTFWFDALAYCENLNFAGHDDWRLPNVRELQSLVDYGRFNPSVDPVFGVLSPYYYWSSTSVARFIADAWTVGFQEGFVFNAGNKLVRSYVRAVRSGP
jgi:hypothetical protein